jgi:vacuolar iron transporter family protein
LNRLYNSRHILFLYTIFVYTVSCVCFKNDCPVFCFYMISKRFEKAREAFLRKDTSAMKNVHENTAVEMHQTEQGKYIKSAVYGGLDGVITTFAVVAGVTGASLSAGIILVIGFANLLADGLSMAVGDYLSTRSEQEYHQSERKREEWEVEKFPEGEKKEMTEIYEAKGFSKKDALNLMQLVSKNKKFWVDEMMVWELGILEEEESPLKNALVTFFSFALFGFVPLLAYVLTMFFGIMLDSFLVSCALTGMTLFALGALKSRFVQRNWIISGTEMLALGGAAALVAYGIGFFLGGLV